MMGSQSKHSVNNTGVARFNWNRVSVNNFEKREDIAMNILRHLPCLVSNVITSQNVL